jgi:metal-responsive CopG/Arc/MetJ family transcriptional regulator
MWTYGVAFREGLWYKPHMRPIQVLLEDGFVREVDEVARRLRIDRSKLIRMAVASFLARVRKQALEEKHSAGYVRHPQRADELSSWEGLRKWPED